MKVKQLKKILEFCNDEDLVVLSKDEEGNSYSPLAGHDLCIYVSDSNWSGETFIRELTPELRRVGFTEEDLYHGENGINAIALFPEN